MSTITHWIQSELATALGRALLHSLWQGAAIALILAAGLLLARRQSPKVRYGMSFFAMAALLLASIATFAWVYEPAPEAAAPSSTQEVTLLFNEAQEALPAGPGQAIAEAATDHPTVYLDYFEQHLPLLVTGWLLGVLLLSLRMLGEIAYIRHLRSYRCRPAEAAWLERLSRMKEQMGIRRQVELLETRRIHSPMVVGVFKQVILLPAGLLSGLSTEQVEAVLAHELAHLRRNDYLANLFLSLVEILLFFNPMMWWISRKIRAEREHACDDLALEMTGDTLALVRSLALLEEWRLSGRPLAMAFTGREGSVLSRIQRLLQRDDKRQVAAKAFWSLSIFCACLALLAFQTGTSQVKPSGSLPGEPSLVEQAEAGWEAETEATPEEEPAAAALPEPLAWMAPALSPGDTIPPDASEAEKEMRLLEEKIRSSEMEMRKKEQALRSQELQIRKEAQQAMQAKQKALMELEMQIRNKEHEREMQDNESEMAEQELELARMELEEKQHALSLQEEQLEEAKGQELQQKLKAFQESQRQLMEKERALELRAFEAQKKQRQQGFEKEKAIQELENRRFQLEQELQMQEQEMEFKMMGLRHEMQQMEAEQRLKEQEIHARYRELEAKMMKLMEDEEE